jgi:hypothetical protein
VEIAEDEEGFRCDSGATGRVNKPGMREHARIRCDSGTVDGVNRPGMREHVASGTIQGYGMA